MESLKQLVGQALIEENSYAVVVTDTDQRIRFVNQAAERIFRYNWEALEGQSLDLLIPPAYCQVHREHMGSFPAEGIRGHPMGERG
ncbi:MAG: PAS domain-containing protein, partial [Thiohalorhabdaceae bacterium]